MVRFLVDDLYQKGTTDSSTEQENYTSDRVLNDHIRQTWRSVGVGTSTLDVTLQNATLINTYFVGRHNLTSKGMLSVKLSDATQMDSPPLVLSLDTATDSFGSMIKKSINYTATGPSTSATLYADVEDGAGLRASTDGYPMTSHQGYMYMLAGPLYSVWRSSDGYNWDNLGDSLLPIIPNYSTALSYDDKLWLIGGLSDSGTSQSAYYSSDGGLNWSEAGTDSLPDPVYSHSSVVFDNKMWIIGGIDSNRYNKAYSSIDGITWTDVGTLPNAVFRTQVVVHDDKMWIIGGNLTSGNTDKVWNSSDGATWTEVGTLPQADSQHAVVSNDGVLTYFDTSNPTEVYTSTDGNNWTLFDTVTKVPYAQKDKPSLSHQGKAWWFSTTSGGLADTYVKWQRPLFRCHRYTFSDTGNPDGYIEVGRVMAGKYEEPSRNISDGFKLQRRDTSRIQKTLGGLTGNYTARDQHEVIEFRYNNVPEAHVDQIKGFFGSVGNHKPFLLSLMPEERPHHMSYYCQMTSPVKQQHIIHRHFNMPDLTFEEKV